MANGPDENEQSSIVTLKRGSPTSKPHPTVPKLLDETRNPTSDQSRHGVFKAYRQSASSFKDGWKIHAFTEAPNAKLNEDQIQAFHEPLQNAAAANPLPAVGQVRGMSQEHIPTDVNDTISASLVEEPAYLPSVTADAWVTVELVGNERPLASTVDALKKHDQWYRRKRKLLRRAVVQTQSQLLKAEFQLDKLKWPQQEVDATNEKLKKREKEIVVREMRWLLAKKSRMFAKKTWVSAKRKLLASRKKFIFSRRRWSFGSGRSRTAKSP